jgi:hypothetical protein
MTDEQKRLVDKLMNTQHDMVVVIAQSAYAEATLLAAQREIRELREVVERWPKTADGVAPHIGDCIYIRTRHGPVKKAVIGFGRDMFIVESFPGPDWIDARQCYSTRAALEQAMGEQS